MGLISFHSFRISGFLFVAAFAAPTYAGVVSVEADPTGKTVTVDAQDANLDEVLAKLGQSEGFTIKRLRAEDGPSTVSGRFEGSVYHVLLRILDHENHVIEHSADSKAGIARVVLYGPTRNIPPSSDVASNRPSQTPLPVQNVPQPIPVPQQAAVVPAYVPPAQLRPQAQQQRHQTQNQRPQAEQPRAQPQKPTKPVALRRGGPGN